MFSVLSLKTVGSRGALKPVLTLHGVMTSFFLTLKTAKKRVRAVVEVIIYLFILHFIIFFGGMSDAMSHQTDRRNKKLRARHQHHPHRLLPSADPHRPIALTGQCCFCNG